MKLAEYLSNNMEVVKTLAKNGSLPLSTLNALDIYLMYEAIDYEPKQMKRYEIVANRFKVCKSTVIKSISQMQRTIKKPS